MSHPTDSPVAVKSELRCPCCGTKLPPDSVIPMPSPDFRSVVWVINGEVRKFTFSRLQSRIVRELWLAYEAGWPALSMDRLIDACETERNNPSIQGLFPKHPAIHTLIVNVGKGLWRLADPS